jgi:hypothetical protein
MRHRPADLGRGLVLAQSFVHNLAQQVLIGPSEKLDLGDEFGPDPMDAPEHQRRAEAAGARRRRFERHFVRNQRLQPAPQARELRLLDAGAGAAAIDEASFRIVIGEQQRAQPRPGPFGIGPSHDNKFFAVEAFGFNPQAAVAGRVERIGAFGDDALERHGAGFGVEIPAAADPDDRCSARARSPSPARRQAAPFAR